MEKFSLQGRPFITLNNLLKVEGLCESGAAAKQVISQQMVLVDGKIETRKRCKILSGQVVSFDGQEVLVE